MSAIYNGKALKARWPYEFKGMKAKLDGIYSPDLPGGYGELPDDPADCWIIVHSDIGGDSSRGADCFTLYVTTPKFLSRNLKTERFQIGRGILIVNEFDWVVVEDALKLISSEAEADSWTGVVSILARSLFYEYE